MRERIDPSQEERSTTAPKDVWVVVEHLSDKIDDVVLEMIGEGHRLAQKLDQSICVVCLGHGKDAPVPLFSSQGVQKLYRVDDPSLAEYTADAHASALIHLIKEKHPFLLLFAATANGSDLAATVASRLRVGLISGCTAVTVHGEGDLQATKPMYEDKIYSTVAFQANAFPRMATIRPGSIGVGKNPRAAQTQVEEIRPRLEEKKSKVKVVGYTQADGKTIDLTEAEIIVSGGHGVPKDNWKLVEELAEILGGAIAGSRIAVDDGLITRERLIGQSGKTVKPALLIALGISGATHHTEGMKESERIIVINNDKAAPFFKLANLSIVADLNEITPIVINKLRQVKNATNTSATQPAVKASSH